MTLTTDSSISIGLGELCVTKDPNSILACYGLGSCIGISAFDPVAKVGGMAHIVLPSSGEISTSTSPAKFANTGVPLLFETLEKAGALRHRVITKIAGGAKMIKVITKGSILDIGERNICAVIETFDKLGLKIHGQDVRGETGRCLWLYMATGKTQVKNAEHKIVDM
jgi:chemotaxis protein CheD